MNGTPRDVYHDIFKDWATVQAEFQMSEPEPDEVFLAAYEYEDYSGEAHVFYRRGEDYFEVSGSHCSCYGLEDQWDPEKYDRATFIAMLQRRIDAWGKDAVAKFVLARLLRPAASNDNAERSTVAA